MTMPSNIAVKSSLVSSSLFAMQAHCLPCFPNPFRNAKSNSLPQTVCCIISKPVLAKRLKLPLAGRSYGHSKFVANISDRGVCNRQGLCFATRNDGQPASEEDKPGDRTISKSSGEESDQISLSGLDWRTFRAKLVAAENIQNLDNMQPQSGMQSSISLGQNWAHPIYTPESGCLLIANLKLDRSIFARTVVLLLRAGSNSSSDFSHGIILNRPVPKRVEDLRLSNLLTTIFEGYTFHAGGPCVGGVFLITSEKNLTQHFEEVSPGLYYEQFIPGLYYGQVSCLNHAAELVKKKVLRPENFRIFLGYSCWDLKKLKGEIAMGYWHVAACSPSLITCASALNPSLWNEILQLMGGQYADISRKGKGDNF